VVGQAVREAAGQKGLLALAAGGACTGCCPEAVVHVVHVVQVVLEVHFPGLGCEKTR
jgi:hypothetical protein